MRKRLKVDVAGTAADSAEAPGLACYFPSGQQQQQQQQQQPAQRATSYSIYETKGKTKAYTIIGQKVNRFDCCCRIRIHYSPHAFGTLLITQHTRRLSHTHTHIHTRAHTYIHTHTYTHTYIHTHIHTHNTHTHIHTHSHAHAHTHTHHHTHTHTHVCACTRD